MPAGVLSGRWAGAVTVAPGPVAAWWRWGMAAPRGRGRARAVLAGVVVARRDGRNGRRGARGRRAGIAGEVDEGGREDAERHARSRPRGPAAASSSGPPRAACGPPRRISGTTPVGLQGGAAERAYVARRGLQTGARPRRRGGPARGLSDAHGPGTGGRRISVGSSAPAAAAGSGLAGGLRRGAGRMRERPSAGGTADGEACGRVGAARGRAGRAVGLGRGGARRAGGAGAGGACRRGRGTGVAGRGGGVSSARPLSADLRRAPSRGRSSGRSCLRCCGSRRSAGRR